MADWADLDELASPPATDIEALRISPARHLAGLPLGCRIECQLPGGPMVSVGMLNRATFDKDEWSVLIVLHEDRAVCRGRVEWWIQQKVATKGQWKIWMDRQLDLGSDYHRAQLRGTYPTTVGEVLDSWGWELRRVATEL